MATTNPNGGDVPSLQYNGNTILFQGFGRLCYNNFMNSYNNRYNLIIKHMSEKYFREGTIDQIKQHDNAKITGWWHDALAYYRLDNFCYSLDEIKDPKYGQTAYLRKKKMSEQWIYYDEWVYVGSVDDSVYK